MKKDGPTEQDFADLEAIEWVWLRELIRPRIESVGFDPYGVLEDE